MNNAEIQLRNVLDDYPALGDKGFVVDPDELERQRELIMFKGPQMFESATEWIWENFSSRISINSRHTSYGLKHIAEREIGYVSNGPFIAAMIHCGYKCKVLKINAQFNVSEKAIKQAGRRLMGW